MAENRNITWNIKLVIDSKVTTPFALSLDSQSLAWGKFLTNPPSQILVPAGSSSTTVSFKACGASCSATGTEGTVVYKSVDNPGNPTKFTFQWDIPYSKANSGNVTMDTETSYYTLNNGGGVPVSGNSVSVDVVITQVGPTI